MCAPPAPDRSEDTAAQLAAHLAEALRATCGTAGWSHAADAALAFLLSPAGLVLTREQARGLLLVLESTRPRPAQAPAEARAEAATRVLSESLRAGRRR